MDVSQDEDTSLTDKSTLYSRYRELLESIGDEDLDLKDKEEVVVEEALIEADGLFKEVDNTRLCILDAQLIEKVSDFCVRNARSVNTNLQSFDPQEFASKIASFVKAGPPSEDRRYRIKASHWVNIGRGTSGVFPRSPFLSYLHGSIDKNIREDCAVKKQRAQRSSHSTQNIVTTKSTLLKESDQSENANNNQTVVLVESTFRQLVREYRNSERHPVNYFSFVLDPNSFTKTVENIFHLSFLIHEGKVALILDEEESPFPFIHPVKQKKGDKNAEYGDEEKPPKYQSVISIQKGEWQELVKHFGMKSPIIDHDTFLSARDKESEGRKRVKR